MNINIKLLSISASVLLQALVSTNVYAQKGGGGIPNFAKKDFSNKSQRKGDFPRCGKGYHYEYRYVLSPASGNPYKHPSDNLYTNADAPRQFSSNTINQLFAHTFNTKELKPSICCKVKKSWLYINGKKIVPDNLFTGNVPANDRFQTSGAGANPSYSSPAGVSSVPYGSTPSWTWSSKEVSAANIVSNNLFSYALGDDTQIRQTALIALSCCPDDEKEPRGEPVRAKQKSSVKNSFMQMMKKDMGKGKIPNGNPRELKGLIKKNIKR